MAKLEEEYTEKQIETLILSPEDTVLDVGCGPGRLTVPIAKRVAGVTALDASPKMLEYCLKNVERAGLENVVGKQLDWTEAEPGKDIGKHDVVVASRSVGLGDILKLNGLAKKYAFIMSFAQSPSLREVQLDLFREMKNDGEKDRINRMFGYNIKFNMLYDLGIDPNVRIVTDGFTENYSSYDEAYDDLRTLAEGPVDEDLFQNNVNKFMTENPDGGLTFRRETKTYIMWWEPKELNYELK